MDPEIKRYLINVVVNMLLYWIGYKVGWKSRDKQLHQVDANTIKWVDDQIKHRTSDWDCEHDPKSKN